MKKITRLFVLFSVITIAIASAFVSCNKTTKTKKGSSENSTIILARPNDSVGLDPARESDGESFLVTREILETLIDIDEETQEIIPYLAKKWEVSEDKRKFTFFLQEGIKFHDGTDFNAEAVVLNFMRQHDETHPLHFGPYGYWSSFEFDRIIDTIKATDTYTVEITLKEAHPSFLMNLSLDNMSILSPASIKKYGKKTSQNPVGTGPYKFMSWTKGDKIILEANENYWKEGPYISKVIIKVIPEATARSFALEKGEIDIALSPSPEDVNRLNNNKSIVVQKIKSLNVCYLGFNTEKKPFDNVLIRKAIGYAINKQEILDAVYGKFGEVAYTPLPPGMPGETDDVEQYTYNPKKAKELLLEAGYPNGFTFTMWPIPVARPYIPNGIRLAEIVQANLADVGITANIQILDWATHIQKATMGEFEAAFLGWITDTPDTFTFLSSLLSIKSTKKPATNITQWKNKEFSDLLDKANAAGNGKTKESIAFFQQAQKIFAEELPLYTIAHGYVVVPIRNYVKNYTPSSTGTKQRLHLVKIEK